MDFAVYVRAKRTDRTPKGHVVALVCDDGDFPRDVESWDEIEHWLVAKRATRTAIKAARRLWRDFRNERRHT
jgi:hypothetical protein